MDGSSLHALVAASIGDDRATGLLRGMVLHPALLVPPDEDGAVPRAVVAQALAVLLMDDLLHAVPTGDAYVRDKLAAGGKVLLDHGAVRTVRGVPCGDLPEGQESVTRVLVALGYAHRHTYELTRLRMTGRSWCHLDLPEDVPQYFVSELHADTFSSPFREATARVLGTSRDPIGGEARADLATMEAARSLPLDRALALLPSLVACFRRQHEAPTVADHEVLLGESAEMAWIATEGTAFNHATDRVADVVEVAEAERRAGRPVKEEVEVSASGRILQTAHRAAVVGRELRDHGGGTVVRRVPGSFFEFITRLPLPGTSGIDLAFDAANAQQIFAMTRRAEADPPA